MPSATRRSRTLLGGQDARARALLVVSAVAFSTAGLFTRRSPVDLAALIFWRNLFGGAALLPILLLTRRGGGRGDLAALGPWGWATIATSAFATLCFLAALRLTSVADVSIVCASAPLLTAVIAWFWLGEAPPRRTLPAAALAMAGVIATLAGAAGGGALRGDALAVLMTLSIAAMTVLARRHGRPPALLAAAASAILAAAAIVPFAWRHNASLAIGGADAAWLALFGVVTIGVALPCYLAGAARLSPARAMLMSALKMPLAPLWVWLAFGEAPSPAALAGGGLVALAIAWDLMD